jgi:hypothetical protein
MASWAQQPNLWLVRLLRPFPEESHRRFFCAFAYHNRQNHNYDINPGAGNDIFIDKNSIMAYDLVQRHWPSNASSLIDLS